MTSVSYVQDEAGNTYIPPTQRPDGTWRKPIPVKSGYVPPEEQPLYVSKGRQSSERSRYPVGLSATDVDQPSRNSRGSSSGNSTGRAGYFEVGQYEPTKVIPGLNFVPTPANELEKKKKHKKTKSKASEIPESEKGKTKSTATPLGATSLNKPQSQHNSADSNTGADPVKRLRNLKKKLKDIEGLQAKIASGDLQNPDPDQLEKIKRKDTVIEEIDELNELIIAMNL